MQDNAVLAVANTVRALTIDAIQKANSGHPGLPMGMAELGALLYGELLSHYPKDPSWPNRDRFVLSAGHGSMFLYALLHLSGYDISMDDIESFRQVGSRTPGHPEYGMTPGIETTTGPLGQGVANAVGMAMAEKMLAARFNTSQHSIVDHYTYALAGDGCLMEGVSAEASSLAGHLKLGKLIVFYDSNKISIDGATSITFTEDVEKRYQAYGWQTQRCDAYDLAAVRKAVENARTEKDKPSFIILESLIGKGSPNKAGTPKIHGSPLGDEEIALTKKSMGMKEDKLFAVVPEAKEYFASYAAELQKKYDAWNTAFTAWANANPELKTLWDRTVASPESGMKELLQSARLPEYKVGDKQATRVISGETLVALADTVPHIVGGSADLAASNNTSIPAHGVFGPDNPQGRTVNFGVREHGMAAACNGLALHGGLRPFCATFLVFSDYMRPSIRLSALMGLPVIYVFTHDSIFLGEDGPTHQPVEHITALRAIPNLRVFRPGDAEETKEAWISALKRTDGPTALVLSRQKLEVYPKAENCADGLKKGAYVVKDASGKPDLVLVATGSEVNMALKAAEQSGRNVRIVSMPSREAFQSLSESEKERILPKGVRVITVEAGVSQGWPGIATSTADIFCIDRFGESGPGDAVADHIGFTVDRLVSMIQRV
jgi:transketolase